jgi:hypothetical protein
MLTNKQVSWRYVACLFFYFLSGSGFVSGWAGAICGVLGTIELATALLHYSPLVEALMMLRPVKAKTITFAELSVSGHRVP